MKETGLCAIAVAIPFSCSLLLHADLAGAKKRPQYKTSGDINDVKVLMTHPAHIFISDGLWIGGMPNP